MPETVPPLSAGMFEIDGPRVFADVVDELSAMANTERWFINIHGNAAIISCKGKYHHTPPTTARGIVGPMSFASRSRMLQFVNTIDWSKCGLVQFVTLTYPDTIVRKRYKKRSQDRYLFMRYVEKSQEKHVPCVWRTEWKLRKTGARKGKLMPHHHLLLINAKPLRENDVREWWRWSIGHDQTYLDVDVAQVTGPDAAAKYIAAYTGKKEPLGILTYRNSGFQFGRHWGITRKHEVPLLPVLCRRQLWSGEIECLRDYADGLLPFYDLETGEGFVVFGEKAVGEICELLEIPIDRNT